MDDPNLGHDGTILSSPDGNAWTLRSTGTRNESLNSVTWTGAQLVAVGSGGAIFTSTGDQVSTSPRLRAQSGLSFRLTSSHLFITAPSSLSRRNKHATVYAATGGKVLEARAGSGPEIMIPIDKLAPGRYVFELKGAGTRIAEPFGMAR